MDSADYVTKEELEDALKPIKAEIKAMEQRLESRIDTVTGEILVHWHEQADRIIEAIRQKREMEGKAKDLPD